MNRIEMRSLESLLSSVLARFDYLVQMNEREIEDFSNLFLPTEEEALESKDYTSSYNELYSLLGMSGKQFEDYLYSHNIRVLAPTAGIISSGNVSPISDGYPVNEEVLESYENSEINYDSGGQEASTKEDFTLSQNEARQEEVPETLEEESILVDEQMENNNVEMVDSEIAQEDLIMNQDSVVAQEDLIMSQPENEMNLEKSYGGKVKTLGTMPVSKANGFTSILLLSFLTGIFSGITFMIIWLIASNV